jgi:hypothetical protein
MDRRMDDSASSPINSGAFCQLKMMPSIHANVLTELADNTLLWL